MNILYNCIDHGVLEFDEIRLLRHAGHKVFSLGEYWNRTSSVSAVREFRPDFFDDRLTALYLSDAGCRRDSRSVSPAFCSEFDVVIASGVELWLQDNMENFGSLPVVFRTIGQSNRGNEAVLAALGDRITIVRYSLAERNLPGFAKTDAVIYFGKNVADFPKWTGGESPVTFHSHFKARDSIGVPKFAAYQALTEGFSARVYGVNEPDGGMLRGPLHFQEQLSTLATAGCYVYVWTQPPSYTLSLIEAMLVGLPIVAPSKQYIAQAKPDEIFGWQPSRYEVDTLLANGCGFVYDSIEEGREQIRTLLSDRALAQDVSARSLTHARRMFDIDLVAEQWNQLLLGLPGAPGRIIASSDASSPVN